MVDSITEDALLEICTYCDLVSLINLSKACKQFESIVQYHLRKCFHCVTLSCWDNLIEDKTSLIRTTWRLEINNTAYTMKTTDFESFMEMISPNVTELRAKLNDGYLFKIVKKFQYPKTHDLRYTCPARNICMQDIYRSFPNLRTFSPMGPVTAKEIQHFHHLKHLNLQHAHMCIDDVLQIISKLKLETLSINRYKHIPCTLPSQTTCLSNLKTLLINECEVEIFLNAINAMKSIRKITVVEFGFEIIVPRLNRSLAALEGRRVVGLTLSANYEVKDFLNLLLNLRKLTLARHLDVTSNEFPNLRELSFLELLIRGGTLENIIISNTNLDKINLLQCYASNDSVNLNINEISKHITKPLTIVVHNEKDNNSDSAYRYKNSLLYQIFLMPNDASDLITIQYITDNETYYLEYIIEGLEV